MQERYLTERLEHRLHQEAGLHVAVEEGADSFPPTDPVVTTDPHGRTEVLGGFGEDALEETEVDRSSDGHLGDEAIADAIRRELREDAATTDLPIQVFVRQGVAHLRGRVSGLEDADNAEAVASRVPGVRDVRDELTVADR